MTFVLGYLIFKTKYVYEVCNPNRNFKALNRRIYRELTELEFMGLKFLGSKHYKRFLRSRFGDIRKLPAKKKTTKPQYYKVQIIVRSIYLTLWLGYKA